MTLFPFQPPPNSAFGFQPTLDGDAYTGIVWWNIWSQRWFLTLTTLTNDPVFTRAMVASPDCADINLAGGYFAVSTIVYRESTNNIEVSP